MTICPEASSPEQHGGGVGAGQDGLGLDPALELLMLIFDSRRSQVADK
jgi:hypothetical protein